MRGLYIHLPFCLKKCSYCDFVSYENAYALEEDYLNALIEELTEYKGEAVDTVYIGGGTPTSLKTKTLVSLLDTVFSTFDVEKNAEVTVECNPKTEERDKFSALLSCGVNRLSIGVQSFDDEVLKAIGRIHTKEDAIACIENAYNAGFKNISADLMFSLPNQSLDSLKKSVEKMVSLPVCHVSCYGLILEDGTPLFEKVKNGLYSLPDEDTEFKMYCTINDILNKHGFSRYEISNFSKDGFHSRHNLKYWSAEEYVGCGAGAHSYYNGTRFLSPYSLREYIKNPLAREDIEILSEEEKIKEFMILGLRKTDGVSKDEFFKRFNVELDDVYKDIIEKFTKNGLLASSKDRLYLTDKGVYISNSVLCEFM